VTKKLRVLFFASLADATGTARASVELPAGADVNALWSLLRERYPALASTRSRPLVACDMEYSDWDAALEGVDEVAFLPPLSGG
jgi:molybdopterin converting factor subunit 1